MSWRRFFRRSTLDEERRREIESYVDIETEDNIARGMAPREARAAALRKLGNPTLVREEVYRMNSMGWLDTTIRDIRFGARVLLRQPGFALVAVLSLGLGVGANTAIFQLIDSVRLRTLPVEAPQELARVAIDAGSGGRTGRFTSRYSQLTYAQYELIRDRQQAFSSLAAWGPASFDLATSGESRRAQGMWVSGNFFSTLKISAARGVLIGAEHDSKSCDAPVATISHAFWQREYSGAEDVIGRSVRIDGRPFVIGGITPESFFGVEVGRRFDVALPICAERLLTGGDASAVTSPDWWWLASLGRLKPGVTVDEATAQFKAMSRSVFEATVPPSYNQGDRDNYLSFTLKPESLSTGFSTLRGQYQTPLTMLLALAGLVLLIACGNLANLMLARASAREQEMAVRLAIGASRGRLVRQLMSESLILASVGALIGAWLAGNLSRVLVSFLSTDRSPLMLDLAMNWRVLGFSTALGITTCLLFGLVPAIRATRTAPVTAMRAGGRGMTDGRARFTLRRTLVVGQLAVSLVLLVGALLFTRTFWNLANTEVGFETAGVIGVTFDLRRSGLPPDAQPAMHQRLLDELRTVPGLRGASAVAIVPMSGSGWNGTVLIDGVAQEGHPDRNQVSGNFFETLGIHLRAGRTFNERDTIDAPRVAVVNQLFVDRYLPNANPIGRVITFEAAPGEPRPPIHIVGVVADTKYNDIRADIRPLVYEPYSQEPNPGAYFTAVAKTQEPSMLLTPSVVAAAARVRGDILVTATPIDNQINDALARERMMAVLSGFFGVLAVLLAAIGLFGVMSYMVAQRRQEIGIRLALGADRRRVLTMILTEACVLVAIGVAMGSALAIFSSRWAEALLFGLTAKDPATIVASVVGLAVIGATASLFPAWRAARVEPTTALRQ